LTSFRDLTSQIDYIEIAAKPMEELLTDQQLVNRMQNGSDKAFAEIYNRYWFKLYSVAYHQTGAKEEAEELVHDVFESLWNKREHTEIRHLSSYLVVSVKNLTVNYIKSQITQRKYQEYLIMHEIQSNSTDEIVRFEDLAKAVEDAMKKLPERTSEIFRMSRFENRTVKDIAQTFNISEKGVEYHITQSLKVLKAQLKAYHTDN
jgi:RNA polymerase sigma-70 factor (family 1)